MLATRLLRDAGRTIGEVLASAVSLLNPSVIVIGGSLAEAGDPLLAGVREVVYRRSLPLATADLRIVQARAGDSSGVVGAAVLVIDHVLAPDAVDRYVGRRRLTASAPATPPGMLGVGGVEEARPTRSAPTTDALVSTGGIAPRSTRRCGRLHLDLVGDGDRGDRRARARPGVVSPSTSTRASAGGVHRSITTSAWS